MEDVLEVYHRPCNPRFPVICMDEAGKQLVGEVRQPLPLRPGQPLRYDSEYERLGTCNIFMFCEPLRGYLNTHSPASFYEAFAPSEARRLTERLEIHYTPKHGSWLNIAECELSVLGRQCLARRSGDGQRLADEIAAWEGDRNLRANQVNWQFTTDDARVKLRRLYPEFVRQDEHGDPCVSSKV